VRVVAGSNPAAPTNPKSGCQEATGSNRFFRSPHLLIVGIASVVLALFGVRRLLAGFPYKLSWVQAWSGMKPLLTLTAEVAVGVCIFLAARFVDGTSIAASSG
jgi:hypothetical protein